MEDSIHCVQCHLVVLENAECIHYVNLHNTTKPTVQVCSLTFVWPVVSLFLGSRYRQRSTKPTNNSWQQQPVASPNTNIELVFQCFKIP